nr:immunoglobulin heavy chain junction region [Macaca mulatta]MOX61577.1 immunoglobulin heavy chain junction region [Macaca mulatta]MOX62374.1 immunoglobulin heavy chain junction region [Macaca mulatta]MOX67586.1 immunoglobulin heavy chain junction region [Macaca mulatta]MOX68057.1 immunoglobulin heavy chain junction region [Macaca mulatta]
CTRADRGSSIDFW